MEQQECTKCKKVLPIDRFNRDGRFKKTHRSVCKECSRLNREKASGKNKRDNERYKSDAAYRAHKKAISIAYYKRHGYKKRSHEAISKQSKRVKDRYQVDSVFRDKIKAIRRHANKIYKFRKKGAGGSYTQKEWKALCNNFGNKCLRCHANGPLTADHIIPVAKGGTSFISNIQPLCMPCNIAKGTKTIDYRVGWANKRPTSREQPKLEN